MILNNLWKSTVGFIFGWSLLAGVAACSQREIQDDDINPTPTSAVSFFVAEEEMSTITRSVLTASDIETKKTGITLAAFKDGNLYCTEHFSSNLSDISIPLEVGSYTVYALVNMGDMTASIPAKESDMAAITYQIQSYTEGDSSIASMGMPMAGSSSYTITSATSGAQTLSVKRLLCKVEVNLNCTWPGGQLLSARVFNMNKTLTPFGENGSAAASTSDILSFQEIMDGPAGTTFSATFYVPENMQGTIQGITNSSDKRPDSGNTDISGKKDLLTYLQVEASGSTKYVGTVTYRSYLGNNATSNFDLARNTRYVWTINYQENGLQSDNWKVDRYLIAEPEAVDLGLSVKWASFNLGALSPEDYGDYYAWGETGPKELYCWSTYKWCNGSNTTLTRYNTNASYGIVDNKTELDLEDDTAHVALGGKWRMPTSLEWQELQDNCSWEWTTINGVNGRKITSNKDGYTDKWIFLPAAGYIYSEVNHYVDGLGLTGEYWSSELNFPSNARYFFFNDTWVDAESFFRCAGFPIRPVLEDEIVSVTYSTPSVTLSYDPVSFDADGGTAIPTVSYTQEVTTTRASGATSTEQITTGGEVTFNMEAVTGFTLDSSTGNITVAQNNTAMTRSTTVTVSVILNGEAGTSDAVTISQSPGTPPVPAVLEAIDLGLSVKWASFNLGALSPEDYGEYYAWGETGPKDNYNWSTYIWCNGSDTTLTKYNNTSSYGTVDNKTVLEPDDDAAHVALGGKWRMPTDEEWTALRTQCTWVWTSNYNGTGVAGMIVTATNGNSIFLPAAGYRSDTHLGDHGSNGFYWSSSLYRVYPGVAWYVGFYSGTVYRSNYLRYHGHSVRPVYDPAMD